MARTGTVAAPSAALQKRVEASAIITAPGPALDRVSYSLRPRKRGCAVRYGFPELGTWEGDAQFGAVSPESRRRSCRAAFGRRVFLDYKELGGQSPPLG